MKRARRALLFYHLALLVAAAGVFTYLILLRLAGVPFVCRFSARAHLYCPGCGFTRALEALLRFDIPASLVANPMLLVLAMTLLYYEVAFWLAAFRRRGFRVSHRPAVIFAYTLLAYAVLRNLLLVCFHIDPLDDLLCYWN